MLRFAGCPGPFAPASRHPPSPQEINSNGSERVMIIIIGLIILAAALVAGVAGVLGNGGTAHALTHFSLLGYHVTGSAGTVFLCGIVVGAAGLLGLGLLLAG